MILFGTKYGIFLFTFLFFYIQPDICNLLNWELSPLKQPNMKFAHIEIWTQDLQVLLRSLQPLDYMPFHIYGTTIWDEHAIVWT